MKHFAEPTVYEFIAPDCNYKVQVFPELLTSTYQMQYGPLTITNETGEFVVRFVPDEKTAKFPEDMSRPRVYKLTELCLGRLMEILKEEPRNYWFALDIANQLKIPPEFDD